LDSISSELDWASSQNVEIFFTNTFTFTLTFINKQPLFDYFFLNIEHFFPHLSVYQGYQAFLPEYWDIKHNRSFFRFQYS